MSTFETRISEGPFVNALVLENPDPSLDDHLRAQGIEPFRPAETPDEEGLIALLQERPYQLIYKRSRVPVTRKVVESCPTLMGVMLCCIGDDSVDKTACADHGVLVTHDPVSNGRSVAELVIGEMICLSRRIFEAAVETDDNRFLKSQRQRFEVRGKVMGIFGMGNIGKQVARLAEALGMRIVFYDNRVVAREVGEAMGWSFVPSLEELFRASDVVSAHVSAADYRGRSNRNVITLDCFRAMASKEKDSPRVFINLARGNIHAADDLITAVNEGWVSRAMVDVYPEEPRSADDVWANPYADCPYIFGTPHIGAATQEAQPRIASYVGRTTRNWSKFGLLRNCVYASKQIVGFESLKGVGAILTVVHGTARGTKKVIDEAVYDAGASNMMSVHYDYHDYGIAYECVALDTPLSSGQLSKLIEAAKRITGCERAIRSIRQIKVDDQND